MATLHTTLTGSLSALETKEQAQEDAKAALKTATQTLDTEVPSRYPEFSSLIDLLRGAVGNTTPAGKQLTNIRKLVIGGGGSGSSSSSNSSSGCSSSSSRSSSGSSSSSIST